MIVSSILCVVFREYHISMISYDEAQVSWKDKKQADEEYKSIINLWRGRWVSSRSRFEEL